MLQSQKYVIASCRPVEVGWVHFPSVEEREGLSACTSRWKLFAPRQSHRESHRSHLDYFALNRLSALVNLVSALTLMEARCLLTCRLCLPCALVYPRNSVALSAWWYPCCGDYWGMLVLCNSSGATALMSFARKSCFRKRKTLEPVFDIPIFRGIKLLKTEYGIL